MKDKYIKLLVLIALMIITLLGLTGCNNSELSESDKEYIEKIKTLKTTQSELLEDINRKNNELTSLNKQIEEKQIIASGKEKYIMKINIAQSHFTLNVSEWAKDAMNDIDIYVEVSKDFYDKYNIGDTIADDFRVGSLVFKGSFGKWNIKVSDKQIVKGG